MALRRIRSLLSPVDFVSIVFLIFLMLLNVVFHDRVATWSTLVLIDATIIVLIVSLARLAEARGTALLIGLHRWYCYPIVIFVFKEIYLLVHPIHPTDYDWLLIAADRWVFGLDPTHWLAQFAHPVLTEILQLAYFSYYFLFLLLGVELYRRYPIEEFDKGAMLIVYGFYLSYLGYFLLPSVGPRFTLHDFSRLPVELPGIFFTQPIRAFIDAGESIPSHIPNPIEYVQRDVFPSGHTQMTLTVIILSFRYRLHSRWIVLALGSLLIISTVYLRYHYVVDLVGGAIFTWITVRSGDLIQRWWRRPSNGGGDDAA